MKRMVLQIMRQLYAIIIFSVKGFIHVKNIGKNIHEHSFYKTRLKNVIYFPLTIVYNLTHYLYSVIKSKDNFNRNSH